MMHTSAAAAAAASSSNSTSSDPQLSRQAMKVSSVIQRKSSRFLLVVAFSVSLAIVFLPTATGSPVHHSVIVKKSTSAVFTNQHSTMDHPVANIDSSKGKRKSSKTNFNGKKDECQDGNDKRGKKHKRRCQDKTDVKDQHARLQQPLQAPPPVAVPVPSPTSQPTPAISGELETSPPTRLSTILSGDTLLETNAPTTNRPSPPTARIEGTDPPTTNVTVSTALESVVLQGRGGFIQSDAPSMVPSMTVAPSASPSMSAAPSVTSSPSIEPSMRPSLAPSTVPSVTLPSASPSTGPSEVAIVLETERNPEEYRLWLSSAPLKMQAVGTVDVARASIREFFFQVVDSMMLEHLKDDARAGNMLKKFELNLDFQPQNTRTIAAGMTRSDILILSYFDVFVDIEIGSTSIDRLNNFQDKQATEAVASFFQGESNKELIKELNRASLKVESIQPVDQAMEDHLDSLPVTSDGLILQRDKPKIIEKEKDDNTATDDNDKQTILYASIVSGSVVLSAVVFAVLYNRRKKRQFVAYYPGDSEGGSLFTDGSRSDIRPAAITVRSKKQEDDDGTVNSEFSSLYMPSGGQHMSGSLVSPQMSFGDVEGNYQFDEVETSEFVNAGAIVSAEGKTGYVGTSALTCLDATASVGALTDDYPEFSLYSSVKLPSPATSPGWSVDGMSVPFSYHVDDEEYQRQRQRWHDEADDLALIVLPDHASEKGYHTNTSDEPTNNSGGGSTLEESTLEEDSTLAEDSTLEQYMI